MADQEALSTAYRDIVAVLRDISAEEEWLPTGCAGWPVRDLLFHLRGDAQRALVALAGPAGAAPDTDAASYWTHWRPNTDGALLNRRMTRISASVYSGLRPILDGFAETTEAVVCAAVHTDPETLDGLLGEPLPLPWDDVTYARAGTGRTELSEPDRHALGPLAERFPLFG
jgi:hypothetical protein